MTDFSKESGATKKWRAARIYRLALETFGDDAKARCWLNKPLRQFKGQSAMEIADTETGAHKIALVLGRIAHGIAA